MESYDIRELSARELERANEIYDTLDFVRSQPPAYRTFGCLDGERLLALSRIVEFEDGGVELGGIWTHPDARGAGLARRMLEHARARVPAERACYLIAFEHLADFYRSSGFIPLGEGEEVPASIRSKRSTCQRLEGAGRYGPTIVMRGS